MAYFDDMMDQQLDLSKVRDRGSKKWVAMMLPEHVKMLRDYNDELKQVPRPQLDEWDLEIIQDNIDLAMKRNVEIKIKRWINGMFKYNQGTIQWIDLKNRKIELEDPFSSFELPLDEIVDVTILE